MKFLSFLLVSIFASSGLAGYGASLYEQGSNKQKELFKFQTESQMKDGKTDITSEFKDMDGNVVIAQTVQLEGSNLIRDELEQKQLNQKGLIEVKDGKAFFTKTKDGKTSTVDENLKGKKLVVPANFQEFVKENFEALKKGETVAFRFGVWDRQETVGFEIFKTGTEKIAETEVLVLKMKPSSFVISALVKPIFFKFSLSEPVRLMEQNGRVAPKMKSGDSYKDLDAEVVYKY
jgi:hypothetical protein